MSQSTRWDVALQQLRDAPTPQLRSEAIDRMTELLQQSEWVLPDGRGGEVAEALQQGLVDSDWCALALPAGPREHAADSRFLFTRAQVRHTALLAPRWRFGGRARLRGGRARSRSSYEEPRREGLRFEGCRPEGRLTGVCMRTHLIIITPIVQTCMQPHTRCHPRMRRRSSPTCKTRAIRSL